MYNRYINSGGFEEYNANTDQTASEAGYSPPPGETNQPPPSKGGLSALKDLFTNNIKLPEINADTILLLVLVYFLITDSDDNKNISDTLLIIGALLLLGF